MALDLSKHPCFNADIRHEFGRVHLPVAPKCNIQCNYCNRLYDCVSESRPGVTSVVLTPAQAISYVDKVVARDPRIRVVGIAGPGDPFANPEETMETLHLVRDKYPEMLLCVSSNGLNVAPYVDELAELQIGHVTITMNTLEAETGSQIYSWVRDGVRIYRGTEGAERLIARQLEAIRLLKERDITVKVNIILVPGINDDHVARVAEKVGSLGADVLNCIPLCPVEGTPLENYSEPTAEQVADVRKQASEFISQMHHCTRCRADAVGLLGEDLNDENANDLRESAEEMPSLDTSRPYVAVCSMEGLLVNRHLGQADKVLIFSESEDGEAFEHAETREAPAPGDGNQRWAMLGEILSDCRAVLTSAAGNKPTRMLEAAGVKVIEMEGLIDAALDAVYNNKPIRCSSRGNACGSGCPGAGNGCG